MRITLKGTLPLVMFGSTGYAILVGRLGLPTLVAQAVGPMLGAIILVQWGPLPTVMSLIALALMNFALSCILYFGSPPNAAAYWSSANR